MLKVFFTSALAFALALETFCQVGTALAALRIAPADLRSDFCMMRDTLRQHHAGLYRYKSKPFVDHLFDSCLRSITDSMTSTEFVLLTSFVIAAIEDGHTNSRLPQTVMHDFMVNNKVFPAMICFIQEHAHIFCCQQDNTLDGAEVLSIDGVSMSTIIDRLFSYIQGDGSIRSKKNWELNENFYFLYHMLYGSKDHFAVIYKTADGLIKETTLNADYMQHFICPSPFPRPSKYLQLSYRPGDIAVMTISTFFNGFLKQTGENFRVFLDSAFQDLNAHNTQKLIIDVRGNQGGNDDNAFLLYSYLTAKPFVCYTSLETTTRKLTIDDYGGLALQYPNKHHFDGRVYILGDGRSFSATADFASFVKSNHRGLFIGEEIGGGYSGNTSGDEIYLLLPHSAITCRIPLRKYITATDKSNPEDRGVLPDYPFYRTVADLQNHRDTQLDYALILAGR